MTVVYALIAAQARNLLSMQLGCLVLLLELPGQGMLTHQQPFGTVSCCDYWFLVNAFSLPGLNVDTGQLSTLDLLPATSLC